MCSNRLGVKSLKQFVTDPRVEPDGFVWSGYAFSGKAEGAAQANKQYREERERAKTTDGFVEELDKTDKYKDQKSTTDWFIAADKRPPNFSRMKNQFKTYWNTLKSNYLNACENDEANRETSGMMLMSRDVGIGNPGTPGGHGASGAGIPVNYYDYVLDHGYFHSGVPVFKYGEEGEEDLIFGKLTSNTYGEALASKMSDKTLSCAHKFFTYDPSAAGKDTFEVPFVQSDKGVLVNWYSGSESISEVLAQLLGGGFFYGFPWTPAIGYTFRKQDIPKLIFVFTNEYDNEISRQNESFAATNSIVAVPGMKSNTVFLNPTTVGAASILKNGWTKSLTPFDPYCISSLNPTGKAIGDLKSDWENFVQNVAGVTANSTSWGDYLYLIDHMSSLGIKGTDSMSLK